MNVLVAIPVYNEIKYVERVICATRRYTDHLLVVDDGSTDGTSAVISQLQGLHVMSHLTNLGYGRTLIDIFNYAAAKRYAWVITMDCDLQHEPSCLPVFYTHIQDGLADVYSGSRYADVGANIRAAPSDRMIINRRITSILNRELGLRLTDSFCGFKAYRVGSLKSLSFSESGYGFPLEFIIKAVCMGLTIHEIPVPLIYVDPGRCFGGQLDDPTVRLKHYMEIIERELRQNAGRDARRSACAQE
ncbi:MAG TPA: glycosyltransferase family 2 protein [Phycisphaerae bacterium]|nr:glycosyltransferase family 2 protein [Phycisphaerae bacterium]HRT52099.1 glycosyltransferase family 2 protein [Anaerohalosphaeraceae bacterium]